MPLLHPPLVECKTPERPSVICRPSKRFGVPVRGVAGRNGQEIKGIVIHCLQTTLETYAMQVCGDPQRLSRPNGPAASIHYGVNFNGGVQQYVDDTDIAWGLDFTVPRGTTTPVYRCPDGCFPLITCEEPNPPQVSDPTYLPLWALTTDNPGIPFDYYLLHIGVEASGTKVPGMTRQGDPCGDCSDGNAMSSFSDSEARKLVQLVAYLAERYNIPIDKDHINFWHNIDPCEREECGCAPCIVNFLCDVDGYCQGPKVAADPTYVLGGPVVYVYGETRYGDKTAQLSTQFLLSHFRFNSGLNRVELYDDTNDVWIPLPTV